MKYRFGEFELDPTRYVLTLSGEAVPIEPQVFGVLLLLVENAGQLVTKVELLNEVWGDQFVSESALTTRIKQVRQAVGDDGRKQNIIRTVHSRGYEFVHPVELVEAEVAPQPPGPAPIGRVRAPVKEIVGRDDQMAHIEHELSAGRMLTLVGPAGAGKTHLARHAASRFGGQFPDGSYFIPLTTVRDGDGVGQAILDGLGWLRREGVSAEETALDALVTSKALVVLDNCEHLLGAVAGLLAKRPGEANAAILATSRQPLRVPGEQLIPMIGLAPDASAGLFVDLAASHGAILDQASPGVGRVCETLDHLPLALELASSRVRVLGLDVLAALLDDRLRLLEGSHDVDAHHQTLEMAIASSFDDLDASRQQSLCRFSQFAGSFDLDAATTLARAGTQLDEMDAVRHVMDLADRSLIVVVDENTATTRYRLLESIRLFAEERLGDTERDLVCAAHAEHFAGRVQELAAAMRGPGESLAAEALTIEWPDVGRALAWGRNQGRADIAIAPLVSLGFHLLWQHRQEGFAWLEEAVAAVEQHGPDRQQTDIVRAVGAWMNGAIDDSEQLLEAVIEAEGLKTETAFVRIHQAMARFDYDQLAKSADKAWELANQADDPNWLIVIASIRYNSRALHDIDDPELSAIAAEVDALLDGCEWPTGRCWALFAKTTVNTLEASVEQALRFERELRQVAHECHAPWFPLAASGLTAGLTQVDDDPLEQLEIAAGALRTAVTAADLAQIPMYLHAAVVRLVAAEEFGTAAELLGLIPQVPGVGAGGELAPGFAAAAEQVRVELNAGELAAALELGRRSSVEQAATVLESALESARLRRETT